MLLQLALIETQGTRLALVPEIPCGAPPTSAVPVMAAVDVPHFSIRSTVMEHSIQNSTSFGRLQNVHGAIQERLTSMARKMDTAQEWLRLGAITGEIVYRLGPHNGSANSYAVASPPLSFPPPCTGGDPPPPQHLRPVILQPTAHPYAMHLRWFVISSCRVLGDIFWTSRPDPLTLPGTFLDLHGIQT